MDRYLLNSTVSWGAIIAGGFVAAAVTLIVAAFGVGAGLAVVSPWSGEGISATTASWAAGLFLVVIAMLASTIGGYITGDFATGGKTCTRTNAFSETLRTASSLGLLQQS
ncbi:MAG: hypothetical protein WCB75_06300 [Pseudolabrys sp.]